MMLKSVDLPQPLGPMTETKRPCGTSSETPSSAGKAPSGVTKRLLSLSTTSISESIDLHPDVVHELLEARVITLDHRGELGRRQCEGLQSACVVEALFHLLHRQHSRCLLAKLLDDGLGRTCRCEQPEPDRHLEARIELADRRQIRKRIGALRAGHRECT